MHDILFRIPLPFAPDGFPVHSYGVMAMIGFLLALLLARWRAKKVGLSPEVITDLTIYALFAGIVGSRIAYVLANGSYFFDTAREDWSFLDFIKIWEGGLVFYGGFIGASVVILFIIHRRKLRLRAVLDVLAPSLVLGHAFGRIGCFLRGCCYGMPLHSHHWYGATFPNDALAYDPAAPFPIAPGTPLFPTQLVAAIDKLIIFGILMLFFKRRKGEGEVAGLYLSLYAIHRFTLEFFRGDTHAPGVLSSAQWISIFTFFTGLALFLYARGNAHLPEITPAARTTNAGAGHRPHERNTPKT